MDEIIEHTIPQLREYATNVRDAHDATKQDHGYERCELCGYTRHPCETFDMASAVLVLLDKAADRRSRR